MTSCFWRSLAFGTAFTLFYTLIYCALVTTAGHESDKSKDYFSVATFLLFSFPALTVIAVAPSFHVSLVDGPTPFTLIGVLDAVFWLIVITSVAWLVMKRRAHREFLRREQPSN